MARVYCNLAFFGCRLDHCEEPENIPIRMVHFPYLDSSADGIRNFSNAFKKMA